MHLDFLDARAGLVMDGEGDVTVVAWLGQPFGCIIRKVITFV